MSDAPKLINDFLFYLEHTREYSKYTLVSYRTDLQQYIEYLNDRKLFMAFPCKIHRNAIKAYLEKIENRGMSPATVGRKLASLRTFFRWLVKIGEISSNPVIGIHPPLKKRAPPKILASDWEPAPRGSGCTSMWAMAYCPWPPVCFTCLPSPFTAPLKVSL